MENGSSPISVERIAEICTALDIDLRDLLERNLNSKPQWEYEAEISRLQDGIHELKLERERLWTLVTKMMRLLDLEASDEVFRMLYRKA